MVNEVRLLGNLGRDPEKRSTKSGTVVVTLNIATKHRYNSNNEWKEQTDWHRVVVWGKSGEACASHLSKGSRVFVKGRLTTRSWDKDGEKRYATEVIAEQVVFLDARKDANESNEGRGEDAGGVFPNDDEIPF